MKNKLYFTLLIGSVLISGILKGQLDPKKINEYDGLLGTTIHDITDDRLGNLWIGTQSGLVKFDGYEYTRFHPDLNDSTTMGEILVYTLYEDTHGNIWIGCQDALYKYNPEYRSFKRFVFWDLVKFQDGNLVGITTIANNRRGRIYFGVASHYNWPGSNALVYYDEKLGELLSYPMPDSLDLSSVFHSAVDRSGKVWLMDWNGLYSIDTNNVLQRFNDDVPGDQYMPDEYPTGMTIDSTGKLWTPTNRSRLFSFDPDALISKNWPLNINIADNLNYLRTQPLIDGEKIWINSGQGLTQYNIGKEQLYMIDPGSSNRLFYEPATALAVDNFGCYWIGTETGGLLRYNPHALLGSFTWDNNDPSTITSGWIVKMIEDEKGGLLVATRGGNVYSGINRIDLDAEKVEPISFQSISPDLNINNVIAGISSGKLLVSNYRGLKLIDYKNLNVSDTTIDGIPDSVNILNVVKDSRGIQWFCTSNGLYMQENKSGSKKFFDLSEFPDTKISSNIVTNVMESPLHGLWILTDFGLFKYDYASGVVTRHVYDPAVGGTLISQDINSFYEDSDGIAWVGTWQGGLSRYDPVSGEVKTYNVNDGLPSMSIQGILGDEKNNALWISTFAGISRFSTESEQFNNYSLQDGIQGLLYADGQYMKTSTGYFLFGGNNGLTYFKPDEIAENSAAPITYITRFNVGDRSVPIGPDPAAIQKASEAFDLAYQQNNIAIEYTGIQYDNPNKNRFSYILENYDREWRDVGNQRSAYYYNLPPGSYTFKLKAANSHGIWNTEPLSLTFRISPPWWKTWWAYTLYGLLFILGIAAFDRIQRKRLMAKQKQIAREKELVQAKEIEKAYHELKKTQSQLVHAEKMASLGELTAGIAHEIQNPLNFVNNFSEVNAELIAELKEEIKRGDTVEMMALSDDIEGNEAKILHHGKRADAIVKNMLQHSRGSGEEKIPTDINALADEYLRLSYHGLRAKDKTFNADFKTELDPDLPKIKVVPQDIGRVLLNIINNAFHAVAERAKKENGTFKSMVTLKTAQNKDHVIISISDNGPGIAENIRKKIFQPFFTTKPSGEGTGLGLSLSYDIVTKGHGGEITIESKERNGTVVTVKLPV